MNIHPKGENLEVTSCLDTDHSSKFIGIDVCDFNNNKKSNRISRVLNPLLHANLLVWARKG